MNNHQYKIKWMREWCLINKASLELNNQIGFGRNCVGVLSLDAGCYPDYEYDLSDNYIYPNLNTEQLEQRVDNNGEIWLPLNAYHKWPCVAVLGSGEVAELQLYEWLRWFDSNGFIIETGNRIIPKDGLGKSKVPERMIKYARMVKQ